MSASPPEGRSPAPGSPDTDPPAEDPRVRRAIEAAFQRWLQWRERHPVEEDERFWVRVPERIRSAVRAVAADREHWARELGHQDLRSGSRVAGYRLVRLLGAGGFAQVWEAEVESSGRRVALKLLSQERRIQEEAVRRFRREAGISSGLDHPAIVQVLGFGEHEGVHYIVQELVAGGTTLADLIDRWHGTDAVEEVDPERAARLFAQLCEGLAYAHGQDVLHRDIKPGNILLTEADQPRISDFGLARTSLDSTLTASHQVLGTGCYMAPEQARGASHVDARSDVYSVGVTLFEVLTGRRQGESDGRPRPSDLPDVPADLVWICRQATQPDPERRYASCLAMHADLRRFLLGKPVRAHPVGRWRQVLAWALQRPAPAAAVVVASLGLVTWLWVQAPWSPSRPTGPEDPGEGRPGPGAVVAADADRAAYQELVARRAGLATLRDGAERVEAYERVVADLRAFPERHPDSPWVEAGEPGRLGSLDLAVLEAELDRARRDLALERADQGLGDMARRAAADIGERGLREQVQQELAAREAAFLRRRALDASREALATGGAAAAAEPLADWLRRELDALGAEALSAGERVAAAVLLDEWRPDPRLVGALLAELAAGLGELRPGDGLSADQRHLVAGLCDLGAEDGLRDLLAERATLRARVDGLLQVAAHREARCEDTLELLQTLTDLAVGLPVARRLDVRGPVALMHARADRPALAGSALTRLGSRLAPAGRREQQDRAVEAATMRAALLHGDVLTALERAGAGATAEQRDRSRVELCALLVDHGHADLADVLLAAVTDDGLRSGSRLALGLLASAPLDEQVQLAWRWLTPDGDGDLWTVDARSATRAAWLTLVRGRPGDEVGELLVGAADPRDDASAARWIDGCTALATASRQGLDVGPVVRRLLEPAVLRQWVPEDHAAAARAYAALASAARDVLPGGAADCMRWALDELEPIRAAGTWLELVAGLDPGLLGEVGARRLVVALRGRSAADGWDAAAPEAWRAVLDVLVEAGDGSELTRSLSGGDALVPVRVAWPAALARGGATEAALTALARETDRVLAWRAALGVLAGMPGPVAAEACPGVGALAALDLSAEVPAVRQLLDLAPKLAEVLRAGTSGPLRALRLEAWQRAHDDLLAEHPDSLAVRAHELGTALCPHPGDEHRAVAARGALDTGQEVLAAAWIEAVVDEELRAGLEGELATWRGLAGWSLAPVEERASWLAGRDPSVEGSPFLRAPVRRALHWLQRHQHPDGYWSASEFDRECVGAPCSGQGSVKYDVGVTSLALLAFLAGGHTDRDGAHQAVVARGLGFLLDVQDGNTGLFVEATVITNIYDHVLATLVLVEAAALTGDRQLLRAAQRGVEAIQQSRDPGPAWRYFGGIEASADMRAHPNDVSVTSWCLYVLAVAHHCGLEVDPTAVDQGLEFVEEMTDSSGRTGYWERGSGSARPVGASELWPVEETEAMTAAALWTRILLDPRHERPDARAAFDKGLELLEALPVVWDPDAAPGRIDYYAWHKATLVMFQKGGSHWTVWQRGLRELVDGQASAGDANGSWDPALDPWGEEGGRVYATAINALTLQAELQYTRLLD